MAIPFRWQAHQFEELLASADRDDVASYILRYLDKRGPTLEAGCGLGRFVVFMEQQGFRGVRGIDVSPDAVSIVKELAPDLDVSWGNVADLPFGDSSMRGIVSLGVVEHFEEGPRTALLEISRVMMPGATAIITVPYLNLVRRLKHALRIYGLGERIREIWPSPAPSTAVQDVVGTSIAELGRERSVPRHQGPSRFARWPATGTFFEYRFGMKEFDKELTAIGLSTLHVARIDTVSGMFYEFGRWLVRSSSDGGRAATPAGRLFERLFSRTPWLHAHMLLFVARKPEVG